MRVHSLTSLKRWRLEISQYPRFGRFISIRVRTGGFGSFFGESYLWYLESIASRSMVFFIDVGVVIVVVVVFV